MCVCPCSDVSPGADKRLVIGCSLSGSHSVSYYHQHIGLVGYITHSVGTTPTTSALFHHHLQYCSFCMMTD